MASLNFNLTSIDAGIYQPVFLDIIFDSGNDSVIGVDALIVYDPESIRLDEIIPSSTFGDYPAIIIDNKIGQAMVSGIVSSPSDSISGRQILATIKTTAIKAGDHALSFTYTPNQTNDSNITTLEKDILTETNSLTLHASNPATNLGEISNLEPIIQSNNPILTSTSPNAVSETGTNSKTLRNNQPQTSTDDNVVYPEDPLGSLENTKPIIRDSFAQPTIAVPLNQQITNKIIDQTTNKAPYLIYLAVVMVIVIIFGFILKLIRSSKRNTSVPRPFVDPTTTKSSSAVPTNPPSSISANNYAATKSLNSTDAPSNHDNSNPS